MHAAIVIIGSNIRPEYNISLALDYLRERVRLGQCSSLWRTEPFGTVGSYFLNVAARIESDMDAESLKWGLLRVIEEKLGRVRSSDKNAPRPIDLDIVLFDGRVVDSALWERGYLALTVAELEPDLRHPVSGETLLQVAQRLHKTYDAVQIKNQGKR